MTTLSSTGSSSAETFAFRFHATTLGCFFAASAAPTPLYRLYRAEWGLSSFAVTMVFAVYAFSLLTSLLTFGSISDHVGRKRVIAAALLAQFAGLVLFATAGGLSGLIAARLVQGFATGAALSALGAALVDLDVKRGPVAVSLSPLFGMAVGAVGSSALVQFAPAPLHLVYAVFASFVLVQLATLSKVPETAALRPGALRALVPHVTIPVQARRSFAVISLLNISQWTLGGFYLSLMPSLVAGATGVSAPLVGGSVVAALMVSGGTAVALLRGREPGTLVVTGALVVSVGIAGLALGVHAGSVPILLAATFVAGAGFGASFLGCIGTLMPLAEANERAALLSAFYVESYLAFSIPAVAAGLLVGSIGLAATTDIYAAGIVALALSAPLARLAGRRRAKTA